MNSKQRKTLKRIRIARLSPLAVKPKSYKGKGLLDWACAFLHVDVDITETIIAGGGVQIVDTPSETVQHENEFVSSIDLQ